MKIAMVLLFALTMVAYAETSAQKVNISVKNAPLEKVLSEIGKQTNFRFLYGDDLMNVSAPITINLHNKKIEDALNKILTDRNLDYKIIARTIIISKGKNKLMLTKPIRNDISINGQVRDSIGPLSGVSVTVIGSPRLSTTTNSEGQYSIRVPENSTLVFRFVGYEDQTIEINEQMKVVDIIMKSSDAKLDEVVVVGYGKQKKLTLTGAVTSVSGEIIRQSPVSNLSNALAGKLPGLVALQRNTQPGANGSDLYIRGIGTFGVAKAPLILVDGIERDFTQIDPNEIENITILKDASSTAVFGVRGANGAILVTTRRGSKNMKPEVSFSVNRTLQEPIRLPNYLGSYDYASLYLEAMANDNRAESGQKYSPIAMNAYKNNENSINYPDVDWIKTMMRPYTPQTQYNLNIVGGGENTAFFVSAGMTDEVGIFKDVDNDSYDPNVRFKRYNFRSNIDIDVTKRLSISLNLSGRLEQRNNPAASINDIFYQMNTIPPNAYQPFFYLTDEYGIKERIYGATVTYQSNPFALASGTGFNTHYTSVLNGGFNANYKLDFITKGLSAKANIAFDATGSHWQSKATWFGSQEVINYTLPDDDPKKYQPVSNEGQMGFEQTYSSWRYFITEYSMNYARSINKHNVTGLVLFNKSESVSGQDINYYRMGMVGRAQYNYDEKYFAEFNMGYNGSENFPKGKRFGFFPAGSAAWIVSKENFLKNTDWLSLFKIRSSYGIVGNDNIGSNRFIYLSYFKPSGDAGYMFGGNIVDGYYESQIGNENVTWEKERKFNLGFDTEFFKSALSLTVDLFHNKRSDIFITRQTVPSIVGAALPPANIGIAENKGLELDLAWRKQHKNFGYFIKANISYAQNKVLQIDETKKPYDYQKVTGQRIGQPFGYQAIGFFKTWEEIQNSPKQFGSYQPGDIKYADTNNDGLLDEFDKVAIGYPEVPMGQYGISFGANLKNFDLSMQFQGSYNSSVYLDGRAAWEFYGSAKVKDFHLNRWTYDTRETATYPLLHIGQGHANNQLPYSSYWQKNGDYIRLKNLEIGYTFPDKLMNKIGIKKLRIYGMGYNMFTWDSLKFLDPETPSGDGTNYPQQRSFTFGINIKY